MILAKRNGWIALAMLLLTDTLLDVIRGTQGNPLWKPLENAIGINAFPLLVPLALLFFYPVVKALGWIVKRYDRFPQGEELVLTALVVIFALHDALIIAADFFSIRLLRNQGEMIALYTIAGIAYGSLAEHKMKKRK